MAASPVLELLSKDPSVTRCSPVPVDARCSNEVFGGRRKSTSPLLNFADLRQVDAHALSGRGTVTQTSPFQIMPLMHPMQAYGGTPHFVAQLPPSLVVCTAPQPLPSAIRDPCAGFLTELAIIATSPHSPLMKTMPKEVSTRHAPSHNNPIVKREKEEGKISPHPASNLLVTSINPDLTWNCFLTSCFIQNPGGVWVKVDDIQKEKAPATQFRVGCDDQLRLISYTTALENEYVMLATFTIVQDSQQHVTALVPHDHPFIVKGKGWCSFDPVQTEQTYRLEQCQTMEIHDVCLPYKYDNIFLANSVKGLGLSELDSDAVLALSAMARLRNESSIPGSARTSSAASGTTTSKKRSAKRNQDRVKRPMNAFMLFAKKFRPEITHDNPGKDNRTISVLLGDKWKEMSWEEREAFVTEARFLSEQHKRLNPDCWKRRKLQDPNKARSPQKS